jgi:hypothetical protein
VLPLAAGAVRELVSAHTLQVVSPADSRRPHTSQNIGPLPV